MKKKKKKRSSLLPIIIILPFFLIISLIYIGIIFFYNNRFLPNTYINNIDVSNKKVKDVNILFDDDIANYTLVITDLEGRKEYILSSDYSLTYLENSQIQDIKDNQDNLTWLFTLSNSKKHNITIESAYDKTQLAERINNLNVIKNAQSILPENAYLHRDNTSGIYSIVPEVMGTHLDTNAILEEIHNAILEQKTEIQLSDYTIYNEPMITSSDPALIKEMENKNAILDLTITHTFGSEKRVLTGKDVVDWITYDADFNILDLDKTSVDDYIFSLAKDFNTFGITRTFHTSTGRTVDIKGGDYGWIIDKEAEAQALIELIKNVESTTREPIYEATANTHDGVDTGEPNTYVEIDLTAQYLWYYVNGSVKVESDITSGMKDRSPTREGTFAVMWKKEKWRLQGETYDVVVDYFIPFYTHVGLHDASWQTSFGGDAYTYVGSHGCINMPLDKVAEIYKLIEEGTIVYCYY